MDWPNHYHFKFDGIFGPIITDYMHHDELKIIRAYCGIEKIPHNDIDSVTKYCVRQNLPEYLDVINANPDTILHEGAFTHQIYYVDLAIGRGAKDFQWAMNYALATGDIEWVTYFKNKIENPDFHPSVMMALEYNNPELVRLIWNWDVKDTIFQDNLVANLGCCPDPLNMLKTFDELKVDCDIDTSVDHAGDGLCIDFRLRLAAFRACGPHASLLRRLYFLLYFCTLTKNIVCEAD